jgi:predicted RNase H-like nuclease
VGPWDVQWKDLPFQLIAEGDIPTGSGHYIVEVHPALALWLWCGFGWCSWQGEWNYKRDEGIRKALWQLMRERLKTAELSRSTRVGDLDFEPSCDDELDAFISWLLGVLWVRRSDKVLLLGNRQTGSMLLPRVAGMENSFDRFVAQS